MNNIEINKQLLPMKAHYFLWNAGTGSVTPYLSTYARQLGVSSIVVGYIYTVLPFSGMLAKPFFGSIADRLHCQKSLFLVAMLLTAASYLGVFFSPKVDLSRQVQTSCYNNSFVFTSNLTTTNNCLLSQFKEQESVGMCKLKCGIDPTYRTTLCSSWYLTEFCNPPYPNELTFSVMVLKKQIELSNSSVIFNLLNVTLTNGTVLKALPQCLANSFSSICDIECNDYEINDLIPEPAIEDREVFGYYQFWSVFLLMLSGWIGQAIVVSVGDAICFEMLGDKPSRYGHQRLYGALGWGIVSALAGILIDVFSKNGAQKDYAAAFYMGAVFLILDFFCSSQLKYTQKKVSTNIYRDLAQLLLNIRVVIFFIWCIGVGMCTGLIWQFLFWLIEDLAAVHGCSSLAYVKTLQGLVQAFQSVLGEAPFFFLSGKIIKKLGHVHTMSLVLLVVGVRFCLYSVITNPWYFLPLEISNGLTFGLAFACMASYASISAPVGTETTMQGLVGAVFEGIGVSIGSYVAGVSYDKYGGALTFRYFGIGALTLCIVHVAVQFLLRGKSSFFTKNEKVGFN